MTTMQQIMTHMMASDDSTQKQAQTAQQAVMYMTASDDSTQKASTDGARKQARARRERTGVRGGERSVAERRDTGTSVSTARA